VVVTVPITEIPPTGPFQIDILLKQLIEEQRVVIAALIEIRDLLASA
jgi:hypothetical protein